MIFETYVISYEQDELLSTLDNTYDANIFEAIRAALLDNMILRCARMFDEPRADTCSVLTICELICDGGVVRLLERDAKARAESVDRKFVFLNNCVEKSDDLHRIEQEIIDRHTQEAIESSALEMSERRDKVISEIKNLKGNHRLQALKRYRNKHVGHIGIKDLKEQELRPAKHRYEEIIKYIEKVVNDLSIVINGNSRGYEYWREQCKAIAQQFWGRIGNMLKIAVELDGDGSWRVEVAGLPEATARRASRDEAIRAAQARALRALADKLEGGETPPEVQAIFMDAFPPKF